MWSPDGEWIAYGVRSDAAGEKLDGTRVDVLREDPRADPLGHEGHEERGMGGRMQIGKRTARIARASRAVAVGAVVAVLSAAWPADAATYYVSQSKGADAWSGKAAAADGSNGPWKTLAKASSVVVSGGDKILLACGDTWNEELHPQGNGSAASPITIGSYGEGKKPVIDRVDEAQDLFGIHLADQQGFKIIGLEFAHCMTGIYAEYADNSPTKRSIVVEGCYFHDSRTYQPYQSYPAKKIGLGACFFSHERHNKIVLAEVVFKNCVFRRLASGIWTNSPDNFNKNAGNVYNFAKFTIESCLFEEGYQWQLGMRGVDGGVVRNCVTVDLGRDFQSFNGVAGAMFARCKNWVFENSEWGCISIGAPGRVSGDGEAFDFESNCDHMRMRNCLFHDTEGPGFLLCCYASGPEPERDIRIENCVLNGKASRTGENRMPKCEIINTTDWNETTWKNCRFYLSKGEILMKTMDPEKDKKAVFVNCILKDLRAACSTPPLSAKARASSEETGSEAAKAVDRDDATAWKAAAEGEQWLELDFGKSVAVTEFKLKEEPSSAVERFVIEAWDGGASKWVGCFNGRTIGTEFVAPIVKRSMQKVRLVIRKSERGNPAIVSLEAFNDTTGEVFNVARGGVPPTRAGT